MFKNRVDAGRQLADILARKQFSQPIVIAIPRGGVVVGAEIARKLKAPLDIVMPRKIGAPNNPEVAIGALTQDGSVILNNFIMNKLGLGEEDLSELIWAELQEIKRRMELYRGNNEYPDYGGRDLIITDDGIATGHTMIAALRSIKKMFKPNKLILAIPVVPPDTAAQLAGDVDQMVCLLKPESFYAVGQFFEEFDQVEDEEVINLYKYINTE